MDIPEREVRQPWGRIGAGCKFGRYAWNRERPPVPRNLRVLRFLRVLRATLPPAPFFAAESLLPSNPCSPTVLIPMPLPIRYIHALLLLLSVSSQAAFADSYTPAVGSPERVAIANAVRASVAQLGGQFEEDARRGAKFVIAVLKVDGRYAFFEGGGQEVNGEMTYGPIDIVAFLGKGNLGWRVLNLQARGDVPDTAEVAQLRASLPPDYPLNIVNKFWRDLLIGARRSN
jgi:hypothetical protein